jgi:hypothetical protein
MANMSLTNPNERVDSGFDNTEYFTYKLGQL